MPVAILIGASGSGKTTIAQLGELSETRGESEWVRYP